MALSPDEARRLATAAVEVQRHYPVPALDPGKVALATLAWTAAAIYWPRVKAMGARKGGKAPPAASPPAKAADPAQPAAWSADGGMTAGIVAMPGAGDWLGRA